MSTYKEKMDELFKGTKFDKALLHKINRWKMSILNKNQNHIEFFSGNLTGVQTLVFSSQRDYVGLFSIMGVTPDEVSKVIKSTSFFNPNFVVEGDPFNHLCVYISQGFLNSKHLNEKDKEVGAQEGCFIFVMRVVIILINDRFIYPVNIDLARQVYESLSNKFLLKKYSSWLKVLEQQADKSVGKEGLHRDRFLQYGEPEDVRYIMSNMQTSISSLLKSIYRTMIEVNEDRQRIKSDRMTGVDMSNEVAFKDNLISEEQYVRAITGVLGDKHSLMDYDVLQITDEIMTSCNINFLKLLLGYVTRDYYSDEKVKKMASSFSKNIILYCLNYAKTNNLTKETGGDTSMYLSRIKLGMMSAKSTDRYLLEARRVGTELVNHYFQENSIQTRSSTRSGFGFYLYLLAYKKVNWSD